ncbi:MAG: hypothetical protein HGA45_27180 [Chloroflexales bacterium]|nr:hypothetical protein [Chloroflexales bacterium]
MLKRLLISITLGVIVGTLGLVLVPYTGRLAEPFLCTGTLEPETRFTGLRFRCIEAADGRLSPVPAAGVFLYSVPLLSLMLMLLIYAALTEAERRARSARVIISADLAVAVAARAEILRVDRGRAFRQQAFARAARLTLVLWVHPPSGRPYEAKVCWLVEGESLARLTVGAVVPVRINPRRPEHVYPDQPWAHYAWWQ